MREMKDSGIEWIGRIPETWEVKRIKHLFTIISGATPGNDADNWDGDIFWITPADYKTKDKYVSQGKRNLTKKGFDSCSTCLIPAGNVIFSKRAPIGTVAINTKELCTNQGCLSCISKFELSNAFYYYVLSVGTEYFELLGTGTTFKEISANTFANCKLPFPSLQIQERIVEFLDAKCAEIDALTSDIQAQIDTLEQYKRSIITEAVTKGLDPDAEMRDSGIPWIGEIPKNWRVDKLKFHLMRYEPRNPGNKPVLSLYRDFGVIPKDTRDDNHNVTSEDTSNYKYVRPGNLVINKMKAWQGSVAVSDYEGIVSPAYFVYKFTDNSYHKRYFHYLLRSCYKDEFMRLSSGIRVSQWDLPSAELDNIQVIIPPISEQCCIAKFLDARCTEIEDTITMKKAQLTTLANYKNSLIFEYVTGKKEVPAS
ncbi:restriction endonuclease subunit S [uncultured Desulfovibrio sp.]|uniref:restriction endonuclease subunit S n=1 Tax=uncultured Desulfovibrio sp. TaxID=167968 RepID=UPI0028056094|nr:restriction endonuclease subunit S [uncultured Desulfovibrio sp.]